MKCLVSLAFFLVATCRLYAQDLSITHFQFASEQIQYQLFQGKLTLKNEGTIAVDQFILVDVYLSTDSLLDNKDQSFCFISFRKLLAGGSLEENTLGSASQFGINSLPGNYYLLTKVDVREELIETNELNNLHIAPITILPARVDLTFANPSVSQTLVTLGATINPTYSLQNLEKDNINSVYTTFYLSIDDKIDASDYKWEYQYNQMAWKTSSTFTQSLTVPYSLKLGNYRLYGKIENYGQELTITETDSANNLVFFSTINLQPDDLDLQLNSLEILPTDHTNAYLTYSISNLGPTALQGYGLKIYFSKDTVLDSLDQAIMVFPFHDHWAYAIPGKQTLTKTEYFRAYSMRDYLPAGEWYAIGQVNYDKKVPETNFLNNTAVSRKFIVPEYQLTLSVDSLRLDNIPQAGNKSIQLTASLTAENVEGLISVNISLYSKNNVLLQAWRDYMYITNSAYSYQRNVQLPFAMAPGEYKLEFTTQPDPSQPLLATSSKTYSFAVEPVGLTVQALTEKATSVLFYFKAESPIADAAYSIQVLNKEGINILDTLSKKDSLWLPITFFEPTAVYSLTVSYKLGSVEMGRDTANFQIAAYNQLVTVDHLHVERTIDQLEEYLPVEVTLSVKLQDELVVLTYDIIDSLNHVVATTMDSVFVKVLKNKRINLDTLYSYPEQQITRLINLSLQDITKPGAYIVKIYSPYMRTVQIPFAIEEVSINQHAVAYLDGRVVLKWGATSKEMEYTVRIKSSERDTLISAATHPYIELPVTLFRPNEDYFWSVKGTYKGKVVHSDLLPLELSPILGLNEQAYLSVVVYPNPSSGSLYLKKQGIEGLVTVQIWTIVGEKVASFTAKDHILNDQLIASRLKPGMYLIIIENQSIKRQLKILVE
ncbi:T9SS type A sorting domain-containing protein [Rhodocytophaga aerolata]|uniref:T9SS type A sorting domain-containing protein n=1 Tax=Rhodocytophaga aerolata TaxID=455078 RepID=A0ABT8REX4_9BACT|nr:T9SS type A sorting domain-containing protein [Rhodocytophaga aerolata]MDO1449738.1 T9SS type A sorting domain-containing protein [Rhodocytophaga aerolata]